MLSDTEETRQSEQIEGLVTIVMAAFNSERFISTSIDSVLRQSYTKWELLVVDDASTDQTPEIVANYVNSDARIRLLRQTCNIGPALARNLAIKEAQGRYIAFLDSDDLWLPEKLEVQLGEMARSGASLSFTAYKKINELGEVSAGAVEVPPNVTYSELLNSNVIGCLTALFDVKKTGKIYMPNIEKRQDYGLWLRMLKRPGHEDYGLWLRLLRTVRPDNSGEVAQAVGINKVLAFYRVHPNTVSSNKLKAAAYQWIIYRQHERLSLAQTLYHFIRYAYYGFRKYRIR